MEQDTTLSGSKGGAYFGTARYVLVREGAEEGASEEDADARGIQRHPTDSHVRSTACTLLP